jgi:hypothetical protein
MKATLPTTISQTHSRAAAGAAAHSLLSLFARVEILFVLKLLFYFQPVKETHRTAFYLFVPMKMVFVQGFFSHSPRNGGQSKQKSST